MGFAAHVAPPLVERGAEPTTHPPCIPTPALHLPGRGWEERQRAMMHRWQGRCLLFHSLLTGGTDMQHARRIAQATGGQRHLDALLLDRRRLPGVALHQQEGPSTPLTARPAPLAGLALRRQGMLDDIAPWAIGAGQHWHNHRCSLSPGWGCAAQTRRQDRRATALKHLLLLFRCQCKQCMLDVHTVARKAAGCKVTTCPFRHNPSNCTGWVAVYSGQGRHYSYEPHSPTSCLKRRSASICSCGV